MSPLMLLLPCWPSPGVRWCPGRQRSRTPRTRMADHHGLHAQIPAASTAGAGASRGISDSCGSCGCHGRVDSPGEVQPLHVFVHLFCVRCGRAANAAGM
jgi:hypothetical protein